MQTLGAFMFFFVATVLLAIGMAKAMMGAPMILLIVGALYTVLFIKYGCHDH